MSHHLQISILCLAVACGFAWEGLKPGLHPIEPALTVQEPEEVTDSEYLEPEEPLAGIASWYGDELKGRPTATGEPFDPTGLTAASWHHPLGAIVEVTRPDNGKSVRVRINDRGPAHRLNRLIDLSHASFNKIADPDIGLIDVEVRLVALPPSAMRSEFALSR